MAPTLYYSEFSTPSRAVLLIARAIGLDLNLKSIDLAAGDHLKPDFLKLNPQHTVPTLQEEDGFTIWDSHVIGPYIASKYGVEDSLYPSDVRKRALVDLRLHFDNSILSPRVIAPGLRILFKQNKEGFEKEEIDSAKKAYGYLETFLKNSTYVAGDELTIADLSIVPTILVCDLFVPVPAAEYPRITAWINKVKSLPYFAEVNEKGFEYFQDFVKSRSTGLKK